MAIAFYCLGTLDVTSMVERQISPTDRQSWKEWIWDQYVGKELLYHLLHLGVLTVSIGCACMRAHGNRRRISPRSTCESEWW